MDPFSDELKCHDISDIQGTGGYVEVPVEKEGASEPRHAFGKCINFASMTEKDLKNLGISGGSLSFYPEAIHELLSTKNRSIKNELTSLHIQIKDIYHYINLQFQGEKIIDAILLSVAKTAAKRHGGSNRTRLWHCSANGSGCDAVILPKITLPISGAGVLICNPKSSYTALLSGDIEVVAQLDTEYQSMLLKSYGCLAAVLTLTSQIFFVVHAMDGNLWYHMPKAVGQALVLIEFLKKDIVHFCVTNGHTWRFAILTKDVEGEYSYYESCLYHIQENWPTVKDSQSLHSVQEIVELALQWLAPTKISSPQGLYHLHKGLLPLYNS
ncbi:hypothetical protein BD769DRAFT_1677051 [Suillus cothurnatus]|nr:hypothetical protein BD769DRAFT_1677051 [Suillus cothurnatus]